MERRQDEDIRTKRQQILEAAYKVFSQKGYNRATVDEIIKLADTGKGTVYNYFTSKEQLFYTLTQERSEPFEQALATVVDSENDPLNKVQEMIKIFLRFYIDNADLWRVVMHEMRGVGPARVSPEQRERYSEGFRRTVGMLEGVLQQGVNQGVFRSCDVNKIAYSLFSVIVMMVFQHYINDIDADAKKIAGIFFYGIVNTARNEG